MRQGSVFGLFRVASVKFPGWGSVRAVRSYRHSRSFTVLLWYPRCPLLRASVVRGCFFRGLLKGLRKRPEPPRPRAHGGNTQGEPTGSAVAQRENGNADHSGQGNEYSRNTGISFELCGPFECGISYMPLRSWHVALGRRIWARSSLRGLCALGASVVCLCFFTGLLSATQNPVHLGVCF